MTIALATRQHESAQHYLHKPQEDTALQATVVLIGEYFSFPIVQVNILDRDQQHTIAAVGTAVDNRPRIESYCHQVVRDGIPKQLADLGGIAPVDEHVRAYFGVPIIGREGLPIGAVCLLDTVARQLDKQQLRHLVLAATVVKDQLELLRRLQPTAGGTTTAAATLAAAIQTGQIIAHYQPIIDIGSGHTVAVEALARWQHPALGLLPPSAFVPLAEDTNIIIDLDLAILQRAATDLADWNRQHPALRLTVNLSARHFEYPECVARLIDTAAAAGVDPRQISFEVTETAAFAGHVDDRSFLQELRNAGFKVLLDDFGTGFSTLDQLLRLPIDGIKLDRTLTAALGTPAGNAISRTLLALAAELNLETVVEGIQTPWQATASLAMGSRLGQGYHWAAAMPAAHITERLASQ